MAFEVTPSNDATLLAQTIVGSGVTLHGTPTLTGHSSQSGRFTGFSTGAYVNPVTGQSGSVSIASGVILSSGSAANATSTYDFDDGASTDLGGLGDSDLTALAGFATRDAVVLTFQFVPVASPLFIQFVFLSSEYPDYVNTQYNDVFGFYVNGANVALTPGGDPISVNTINLGRPVGSFASNAELMTQYSVEEVTPYNFGGSTVLLTVSAPVTPGEPNTFKFALADGSDWILDSAVLIGTGYFSTSPTAMSRYYAM